MVTDLSLPFLAFSSLRASSAQPLSVGCEIRAENDIIYTHELLQTERQSAAASPSDCAEEKV